MSSAATRWSGRPKPQQPPLVATDEVRGTWPGVDTTLVRGGRRARALPAPGVPATATTSPPRCWSIRSTLRYASGTSIMPLSTLRCTPDRPLPPGARDGRAGAVGVRLGATELVPPRTPGSRRARRRGGSVFGSAEHAGRSRAAEFAVDLAAVPLRAWASRTTASALPTGSTPTASSPSRPQVCTSCPRSWPSSRRAPSRGPRRSSWLRRSVRVCDAAVAALYEGLRPGYDRERGLGGAHGRGVRVGWAEYAECRLLWSGPRTNPWFREASDRRLERGYFRRSTPTSSAQPGSPGRPLAHLPRRLHHAPSARQRRLYADAQAFLAEIIAELRPGAAFDEVGERLKPSPARRLPRGALPVHRARQRPR